MKKGQLSIEVIILLAIFLLFFQAILMPSINFAENILKDTHAIVQTKKSIDNFADNIEQFASSQGYGTRKVFLYLPNNAIVTGCSGAVNKTLDYNITISTQKPLPVGCNEDGVCSFSRELYISNNITCAKIGPGNTSTVTLEKENTGNIIITLD